MEGNTGCGLHGVNGGASMMVERQDLKSRKRKEEQFWGFVMYC